jgi:CRISPR-associated protein Csx17
VTRGEHTLGGCRPEPLGSYLKALGVLRLVAAQADPTAKGCWVGDRFALHTMLAWGDLVTFLLDAYVPTPVVSPWNSGSGFGKEGEGDLELIERSSDLRFEPYRRTIAAARSLLERQRDLGWDKVTLAAACRSELPDEALPWIDAAIVLAGDRPEFPPLLGSGGNDGRLEFSHNFQQRVIEALGLRSGSRATGGRRRLWLEDALSGSSSAALVDASPGQFDPGGAGGSNSSSLGKARTLVNPWDFVLLIEGTMLFASGSSRRLAAGARGMAAMPFMVSASPVGYPSAAAGEGARGELWAPLWSAPAGARELERLFGEGRVEWRGRRAASALDAARAAVSLGVDRGIGSFCRYSFAARFGTNHEAVPAGRTTVSVRPEVAPLGDLDSWVERVRRATNPPASVTGALRSFDQATFDLVHSGGGLGVLRVLVAAGALELAVSRSGKLREAKPGIPPIQGLSARRWVPALLSGGASATAELRLAIALSSGRDLDPRGRTVASLRLLVRPVATVKGGLAFTDAPVVSGLGARATADVLAEARARRMLAAGPDGHGDRDQGDELKGVASGWQRSCPAALADVTRLACGEIDDRLLAEALGGVLLLDWDVPWVGQLLSPEIPLLEPALCVLGPFFAPGPPGQPSLLPEATWAAQLLHGRTEDAVRAALRRLRIAGLDPVSVDAALLAATAPPGPRLAAALLCPLSTGARRAFLDAVAAPVPDLYTHTGSEEEHRAQP